ncbi:MAG TPA: hypothetical protein VN372_08430 [Methanospirillum sp.]|nr:hypothetical protein [Methanospirillum sp.]
MTDVAYTGVLTLLLIALTATWVYPVLRPEIEQSRSYNWIKSFVSIIAGLVLIGTALVSVWEIFLLLRVIAGGALLYDGIGILIRLYRFRETLSGGL